MSKHTIAFDEQAEGWTSFYSYLPDWMLRLGNEFFTLKEGQLYIHHATKAPRNNFYGVQHSTKMSFAVNQQASDIKIFKALGLEGNQPWEVIIKAFQSGSENYSESTVKDVEFVQKEGYWYAYVRRNELASDFSSKATYGIGVVTSQDGATVNLSHWNDVVSEGDVVFTGDGVELGKVLRSDGATVTLDTMPPDLTNQFLYGVKDARIEGAEMRGYTSVIEIENSSSDKLELFAVNTEAVKSYR